MSHAATHETGPVPYQALLGIFADLDMLIMVTDLATDEILYANDRLRAAYDVAQPVGLPCWQVCQQQTSRCPTCPMAGLAKNPTQTITWEAYNQKVNKWFRYHSTVVTWANGQPAHLQQGVDITMTKRSEAVLKRRVQQQALMSSISQSFISTESTETLVENALALVGKFLGADRMLLARIAADDVLDFSHLWCAPGAPTVAAAQLQQVLAPALLRRHFAEEGRTHTQSDDTTTAKNADHFARVGVTAFLAVPVWVTGRLWGMLSCEMSRGPRAFGEDDVTLARMVANVISGVVQRTEMLAEVRMAEKRTQVMLDTTPLAANFWDTQGNNIDCNQAAADLFDLPDKQAYLDRFAELSPPCQPGGQNSAQMAAEMIQTAFRTGQVTFEWMHQKLDGTPVPSQITLVKVKYGEDDVVVGFTRDMREILAAETRTQAMLDATPLSCTFFGRDGQVVDCNQEALRMYGLASKEEFIAQFPQLSPPLQPDGQPSAEKTRAMLNRAFESGREVFEWMHCRTDGTPMPAEITLVRVGWKDGYRIAGYSRDLRREKAHMAEIERAGAELVAERDRAEAAARAKTNFLANMSHEIRTPMNAIIGMTSLARKSDEMPRVQYCLGKVDDAAQHLLGVINDILDMSKIEAGKLELSPADFVLEKMLQRVTDIASFRAEQKHQEYVIKVDSAVPAAIVADEQRLAQVLTNFLSNAVKFTPDDGKIALLVSSEQDEGDACTLLFEVVDSGIGLSAEQQDKLFQSFEQADGSISRRFGGTGLGLAISKNIIQLMGGTIGVESAPGEGACFWCRVPVKKGRAALKKRLREDVDWKNLRLLVVDDAPEVLEYFADIAATIGVQCETAPGAEAACRMLEQAAGAYHVLFVDWMMPGMNGIELTRHVREQYGHKVIVIMISVVEWEQIRNEALNAGVDRFIAKPLLPSRIIDCINETLGESERAGGPALPQMARQFGQKRILLAEDVEINREILLAALDGTGLEIECAEDGRRAVEMFRSAPGRYDLILMDIHMPQMDGYAATRAIRAMADVPGAATVPIVAMTANVFKEDVERCLAAGMNDHVGKPVDMDDLMDTLRRYI